MEKPKGSEESVFPPDIVDMLARREQEILRGNSITVARAEQLLENDMERGPSGSN